MIFKDRYEVSYVLKDDSGHGRMLFSFTELEIKTRELNCTAGINIAWNDEIIGTFSGRLNLRSISSREGFIRPLLRNLPIKLPLDMMLSDAIEILDKSLGSEDGSHWIEEAEIRPVQFMFSPFLVEGVPNLLFGKGGTGKSYFCLRLAISVVSGRSFLDLTPNQTGKVLYLDFEDTGSEAHDRLLRLCGAFNPDWEAIKERIRYFRAVGRPLKDLVPILKHRIQQDDVKLLIVDSANAACGGRPEEAEIASLYFNSLAQLEITSLTIAHETKAENHAYPFGSVVWWNMPRNIWNAQSKNGESYGESEGDPEEGRTIDVGFFHRKCNSSFRRAMIPTLMTFKESEKIVNFSKGAKEAWPEEKSDIERIAEVVKNYGAIGCSAADVKSALKDITPDNIQTNLKRLGKDPYLSVELRGGRGGLYYWIGK